MWSQNQHDGDIESKSLLEDNGQFFLQGQVSFKAMLTGENHPCIS